MPRPKHPRRVAALPTATYFKPRGIPLSALDVVILALDEFEALRLSDLEGLYQEDAAKVMGISRQTFARLLESAHKKVADVVVNGKALRIEGLAPSQGTCYCKKCNQWWVYSRHSDTCPRCKD